MKIEEGRRYKTRGGQTAVVVLKKSPSPKGYPFKGYFVDDDTQHIFTNWDENGSWISGSENEADLVSEIRDPWTGWMIQSNGQDACQAPSEEVAKKWAAKTGGRAFMVREVVE